MIWIWVAALVLIKVTSGLLLVIALAITIYKIKNSEPRLDLDPEVVLEYKRFVKYHTSLSNSQIYDLMTRYALEIVEMLRNTNISLEERATLTMLTTCFILSKYYEKHDFATAGILANKMLVEWRDDLRRKGYFEGYSSTREVLEFDTLQTLKQTRTK